MYQLWKFICIIAMLAMLNTVINGEKSNENFIRVPLTRSDKPSRVRRAAAGPNGSKLDLWNDRQIHYSFYITVGTPPQKFVMTMDTGSSDIWLPSVNCKSEYICRAINKYNASASSTQKSIPGNFTIQYGIGSLTGLLSSDVISYGGMAYGYPFDGTFGFGFAQVSNSDRNSTPIDNLYDQGQITKKLFCVHMNPDTQTPGGELIIGGCDVEAEAWLTCQN